MSLFDSRTLLPLIVLLAAWPVRLLPLRKLGGIQLRQYFAHYPRLAKP